MAELVRAVIYHWQSNHAQGRGFKSRSSQKVYNFLECRDKNKRNVINHATSIFGRKVIMKSTRVIAYGRTAAIDGWTISLKALYHHRWQAPRKNTFGGQDCPEKWNLSRTGSIKADLKWMKSQRKMLS